MAAFAGAYIAWCVPTPWGFFFAAALPLLVLRIPVTGIVLILVIAQEVNSNGHRGFLNTLANDVYIGHGKIPMVLPLAIVAALAAFGRSRLTTRPKIRLAEAALFGSVVALVLLTFFVGLANGQDVMSAANQNARPFFVLLVGLTLGVSLKRLPGEARTLRVAVAVALTALTLAAFVAVPMDGTADGRLSPYFIYYDWALPTVAAALLIALLSEKTWLRNWRYVIVAAALPLLILVSFRRSVWIAAALVLAVALVLAWRLWKNAFAHLAVAGVLSGAVVLAAPGFAEDLLVRGLGNAAALEKSAATAPASPTAKPASTPSVAPTKSPTTTTAPPVDKLQYQNESNEGHFEDLRLGWRYSMENFWTGVGPKSPQLPGLAAKSTARVYVHNELLQGWLRYGPAAPLLLLVFFISAGLLAMRAMWNAQADIIVRAAAAFCLLAPIVLMTGAFLTDTSRWPLLLGIAAGLLTWRAGQNPPAWHSAETMVLPALADPDQTQVLSAVKP